MNPLSRKTSWILWIVIFIPYLYFANIVMPATQKKIRAASTDPACARALDIMIFAVDEESVLISLGCMGPEGREVYRSAEQKEDVAYPLLYTLFFLYTLFVLVSFLFGERKTLLLLLLLPLLGMSFDFYENWLITEMIGQFPALEQKTIQTLAIAGSVKWVIAFVNILLILVLAVAALVKLLRKKKPDNRG